MSFAFAVLVLRVVLGLFMIGHGSQKLLGWFGGSGLTATTKMMGKQGFKPGWLWALLGSLGEFGGGILLVLGLLTPLGAIATFAAMLMATVKFHGSKGFFAQKGGYEYPLLLLILSLVVGLTGPGSFALDTLIGFALPTPLFWALLLVAIIVVAVGIVISNQQSAKQQSSAA
jgi:putative oxidoreductase